MKLLILLFLFIVVTCQAHQSPPRKRQISRQGDPDSDVPTLNKQNYEKIKKLVKKYMFELDPDLQKLLFPEIYKVDHLRTLDPYKRHSEPLAYSNPTPTRFNYPALQQHNSFNNPSRSIHPAVLTRFLIPEPTQLPQVAAMNKTDREARLAQVDKEALSKLSEEDKKLIESSLSPSEREALLAELEDGKLYDLLPREEYRFSDPDGVITGAAAHIGSSAGKYIGHKLAGTLGAKLGAAAGAYLGAAAVSQFVKKTHIDDIVSDDGAYTKLQGKDGETANSGFGALNV